MAKPAGSGAARFQCWKLGDLSETQVLASAVSAARQAKVIVLSLQAAVQLPLAFFVWLEGWLPHRTRARGTFVALIGVTERASVDSDRTQRCLRSVARLGGLDFYLEERLVPREPNGRSAQPMQSPAGASITPPRNIPAAERFPRLRRWGLDE
jgi:hypothetical protein